MLADLRHAIRSLLRAPAYSLLVVATLSLGVSANTAFFSVLYGILLRPLAYEEPERIMTLWESNPRQGLAQDQVSGGTYQDWRRSSPFDEQEAAASNGRQALLSNRLWAQRYGADEGIVGDSVTLDGEPYTVVGVMPPGSPISSSRSPT